MNEPFVNLNTVTLYNTPMFNKIDSVLFSSATARDNYFNSIPSMDKLEITDFTDLYEGRSIVLPYNYLTLKNNRYNIMKLYYNDGEGHTATYYCNVDNYMYLSTEACIPIYRIDYFLTYGYMFYNKNITMFTERRTVAEHNLTKNMKADEIIVPKLKYDKIPTYFKLPGFDDSKIPYYVIFLNKTTGGVGKMGITCKMQFYIGTDSLSQPVLYNIDTYTIGCYVAITDSSHLNSVLANEPLEYIEKIIEVDTPIKYLHTTDQNNLDTNGYVYLTQDISIGATNDEYYFCKVNLVNDGDNYLIDTAGVPRELRINLYPNHKKRILEWQPTKGIVIQGYEFDIKDFDDLDFPTDSSVVRKYDYMYSTIYFFNFLGYTFAYPLGYKHENVNMDYSISWQSGRNFSYSSDYTNSLAYKELRESNNTLAYYTKQQAGLQTYYNNQILANAGKGIDISKNQNLLSYQGQVNNLNTEITTQNMQYLDTSAQNVFSNILSGVKNFVTFNWDAGYQQQKATDIASNNIGLLRYQKSNALTKYFYDNQALENQKEQLQINTTFQNDLLALMRDNTLANISISNKYNNAKPNAYYETDYKQFSSYYYIYYIDTTYGIEIEQNIKNHYNVYGTYVGYIENWVPGTYDGLYFDYIKGSIINNTNEVSQFIPTDVYIELVTRIEEGIRIWKPEYLGWFGNLTQDNTNLGLPEPYYFTIGDDAREDINNRFNEYVYNYYYDKNLTRAQLYTNYGESCYDYIDWLVDSMPFGDNPPSNERKQLIDLYCVNLIGTFGYTTSETREKIINADWFTIYEKQYELQQL